MTEMVSALEKYKLQIERSSNMMDCQQRTFKPCKRATCAACGEKDQAKLTYCAVALSYQHTQSKSCLNQRDYRPATLGTGLMENLTRLMFLIMQKVQTCQFLSPQRTSGHVQVEPCRKLL